MNARRLLFQLLPLCLGLWFCLPPPALADIGSAPVDEEASPAMAPSEAPATTPVPQGTVPTATAATDGAAPTGGGAGIPEEGGAGIPLLPILGALLAAALLGGLAMLLLARRSLHASREAASAEAQLDSSTARRGTGHELDDVRRDLEATREVLRAADRDEDVGRCREIERAVIALQDQVRRLPSMGGPSALKVEESRGMAAADSTVRERSAALLEASNRLRNQAEAGAGPELADELKAFARQVQLAGSPHKDRPQPVQS